MKKSLINPEIIFIFIAIISFGSAFVQHAFKIAFLKSRIPKAIKGLMAHL